jgi:hypothetical protein
MHGRISLIKTAALAGAGLVTLSATAFAQAPTLTPASVVVAPGGSVAATVSGLAGQNYAVLGSRSNSGCRMAASI